MVVFGSWFKCCLHLYVILRNSDARDFNWGDGEASE